ncbi:helix-turn-helix domain-containing protein [Nitratireductor sp. ZSWI3]|uniref:helix-turn-helix domain-containing protein n=1 Tax=Nitratireductor sp. ZSWI3 TaxID=2966359 RepID=UPI0021506073|nr:helix-turn-helix transcriptional regulator [Nitratireductor sp. ZSWI3]MCR4265907.1 helix-turn-helix transcriptional regulator [Nitratireductor sp. ZSWI3]
MNDAPLSFGQLLRGWRNRRSLSQLALAAEAEISQRHLSFIESGRSVPSREMILRLGKSLDVPLRERNVLLVSAGFAPVYKERRPDDPSIKSVTAAVTSILRGHEPFPALALDRHWTMLDANRAIDPLIAGADEKLLRPPVNVLRLSLHPDGLAPRILNFREWRAHVLDRLSRQIGNAADPILIGLRDELGAYPVPPGTKPWRPGEHPAFAGIAVPLQLKCYDRPLSFLSATTVFGSAYDIRLSELTIETFLPADKQTMNFLVAAHGDTAAPLDAG